MFVGLQGHCASYRSAMLLGVSLLVGCSAIPQQPRPNDPAYAPVPASGLIPPREINGAIYQANQTQFYFTDRKARRVGDILTILLEERTTAIKESETEITRESSSSLPEPTLFDKANIGIQTSYDNTTEFTGEADSDLKNSLQGSISVTVVEVLPGGTLRIAGEKWMTLNRGDEYIRISGLVRPDDIGPDNSVMSTKIADARIAYSQTGEMAAANRMGWLSRFFSSRIWPF